MMIQKSVSGTSLVVQWLSLLPSTAGGVGSIPGWGTKIPNAMWCGQKPNKQTKIVRQQEKEARWAFIVINGVG